MKKNLNLSEKEFNKLVIELQNGNEKLFEIAFRNLVVQTIIYLKKKYNVDDFDIKDAAATALYNLRNKLIEGKIKPLNIRFLYSKMVMQEYQKIKKSNNNLQLNETIYLQKTEYSNRRSFSKEEQFQLLEKALEKLEKQCIELLNRFYRSNEKLIDIAEQMNISYDLLRKRKQRCVDSLRMILKPMINSSN